MDPQTGCRHSSDKSVSYSNGLAERVAEHSYPNKESEEKERQARVNAAWEQMNSRLPPKTVKTLSNKSSSEKKSSQKRVPEWMVSLGLVPSRKPSNNNQPVLQKKSVDPQTGTGDEAKKLAAAALSAVKNAASMTAMSKGKIEITEVRDFAGENVEVKKLVDVDSKEAAEKAKAAAAVPSALDNILEQIKKKPKLSVLDKTKKDWGEFKEENKGLEDELDIYKKSSNQYLDKVSFLQRTDIREFERERDARLALQAKRRTEVREQDF